MFKPVQEDKEELRDCINQTEEQDTKETSATPDSTDSALGSRDDDCKSPSIASESSLCTSDNKSKDSKRSPVPSDAEEQDEIKCKRLKESQDHSESPESFSDGSSAYGNDDDDDDDDNDDDNDGDNNNQDDLSSGASSNPASPQLDTESAELKSTANYLKPAACPTVTQPDTKTAASEDEDDEEDDSDNSDSDSGSESEESGSGQQEESTEESTRPSSEAQSSTEEPAPSQELLFNIKHEPVDPELGPVENQGHSQCDSTEQLDVKPVLGIPPDYYRSNNSTNTGQTEATLGDRASPVTSEVGGPAKSPVSMSVSVSSSSAVASTRPCSPGQEKTAALQSTGLAGLPTHMLSSHLGLLPPHQGLLPHHFLGHQGPLHAPPPLVPASSSALSPMHGSLSVSGHSGAAPAPLEHLNSSDSLGLTHSDHHRTHTPPRTISPGQGHLSSDIPVSRSPQLHLLSRSPPSHMTSGTPPPPHRLSQTPPPHGVTLSRSSPLSHRLSRSSPPHRSHSPGALQPTNSSRPPSRSRSRSPLSRESDSEPEGSRSPSPEPRIMNEECHRTKSAIFIKRWYRGQNSCSRCDLEFQPYADSRLAQKREERQRKISGSSSLQSVRPVKEEQKEDISRDRDMDRDRDHMEDKSLKKADTPPENKSADAQITSTLMNSQQVPPYALERHTPRAAYPPGHDPTPALRTLSEYARPHALGAQDQARSLPYTLANLPPHAVDPYYRMASMYPPGSRERLELELERDKRERDERERQLRERELREMELREKMKHEMDLKPPGFDRFPPSHLDPQYIELQRHMTRLPPGAPPPGSSHIPGVYPPASLASDLLQRERERIDRLEPVHPTLAGPAPSAIAIAAPSAQNNPAAAYEIYHRSYTPEQIWLMQRQMGLSVGMPLGGGGSHAKPITEQDLARMESGSALLAHYFSRADPLGAGAAIGPQLPPTIPPGHPLLAPAREQELLYRELLNRPPCNTDPVLAHQLTVQHEAIQRHLAMERERLTGGAPPGPHLPH